MLFDASRSAPALLEDAAREVIAAAAALHAQPPASIDVAVVLAGAGDAHAAGLSEWLRGRRRRGLDPASVAIVHLEAGEAPGTFRERDGVVVRLRPHRQLLAAAHRARSGRSGGDDDARPGRHVTPAGVVGPRGWPAIAIGADATFAEEVVRELDLILGRVPRSTDSRAVAAVRRSAAQSPWTFRRCGRGAFAYRFERLADGILQARLRNPVCTPIIRVGT